LLQSLPVPVLLVFAGFALLILSVLLLLVIESKASARNRGKGLALLLEQHPSALETALQGSLLSGILLVLLTFSLTVYPSDPVLSLDAALMPVVVVPLFSITLHRRMRHFSEIVQEKTTRAAGETFEALEPVLYAKMNLVYWLGSLVALAGFFLFRHLNLFPVFAVVLMHYGVGGLFFFTSPLLFSAGSLRRRD
jgi:hypothetical protein